MFKVMCCRCFNLFSVDVVMPETGWFVCMECVNLGTSLLSKAEIPVVASPKAS